MVADSGLFPEDVDPAVAPAEECRARLQITAGIQHGCVQALKAELAKDQTRAQETA